MNKYVVGLIVWAGIGVCVGCLWPSAGLHALLQNWSASMAARSLAELEVVFLVSLWGMVVCVALLYVIVGLYLLVSMCVEHIEVDLSEEHIREVLRKENDVLTG